MSNDLGEVEADFPSSESASLPEPLKSLVETDIAFAVSKVVQAMDYDEALSWAVANQITFDDLNDASKALERAAWRLHP